MKGSSGEPGGGLLPGEGKPGLAAGKKGPSGAGGGLEGGGGLLTFRCRTESAGEGR